MKSLLPSTPMAMPRSNTQYPKHQIADHGLVVEGNADRFRVKERVALEEEESSINRVILGVPCSMAEAPVTPLTCRENARSTVSSLTPFTDMSFPKGDFDGCCDEWSEKETEEEKPCSSAAVETPEHCTFDPFACGPEEPIFAPKKKKEISEEDEENGIDHVPFEKPISPKKACKVKDSKSNVARVLCFDECIGTGDGNHSLSPSAGTPPSSVSKGQDDSHLSQALMMDEEAHLKHQRTMLHKFNQNKDSQVSVDILNVPSESRPRVFRVLDLDSDKHSDSSEERCKNGPGNDHDTEDVLLEESFVEAMCGSFLQAILAKQYEDANMNNTQGNNEKDGLSHGQDQRIPSTPISCKAFSSTADVCPGAPMKARSKPRFRGTGIGPVCRKLEF